MAEPNRQYADVDTIEPYALLALEATVRNQPQSVAPFLNGAGFTEGGYRMEDGSTACLRAITDLPAECRRDIKAKQ